MTGNRSRPDALQRVPRHAQFDPNLFYDPATGYNGNRIGAAGRIRPTRQVLAFTSDGHRDQTQISSGLTRRLQNDFQAGATYTLMLAMHDDGRDRHTSPGREQPVRLPRRANMRRRLDFQRIHAARVGDVSVPVGHLDERVVLLRLGQSLTPPASRRRLTARPAPTG